MTHTIGERVNGYGSDEANTDVCSRLNTWFRFADPFYGLGTPVKPLKKLVQSGMLGWPLKVANDQQAYRFRLEVLLGW